MGGIKAGRPGLISLHHGRQVNRIDSLAMRSCSQNSLGKLLVYCQSTSDCVLTYASGEARTWVFSRLGAMESISSIKMMAGEFFSASSKAFRRLLSLSPASLDMISGPLIRKKKAPVSLATALAISVLPIKQTPKLLAPHLTYQVLAISVLRIKQTPKLFAPYLTYQVLGISALPMNHRPKLLAPYLTN